MSFRVSVSFPQACEKVKESKLGGQVQRTVKAFCLRFLSLLTAFGTTLPAFPRNFSKPSGSQKCVLAGGGERLSCLARARCPGLVSPALGSQPIGLDGCEVPLSRDKLCDSLPARPGAMVSTLKGGDLT